MVQTDYKRVAMTLYVEHNDPYSYWMRIVLAEKGVRPNIIVTNPKEMPAALTHINPNAVLPVFVDQDLVLYQPNIVAEYLEERFPHPPLLPVYPMMRAKCRHMIYQIQNNWYPWLKGIEFDKQSSEEKLLQKSLASLAPLFGAKTYFLNDDFTLVDCCIAPVLWRLKQIKKEIIQPFESINNYQSRVFERLGFRTSVGGLEKNWIV